VNSIIDLAIHPGKNRLEKSLTLQSRRWKSLLLVPRENDAYFLRVRTENANSEITANPMRPKNPERIGMCAGEKRIDLVYGQTGYFERAHACIANLELLGKMSCADF
jgi:hypothetical protein